MHGAGLQLKAVLAALAAAAIAIGLALPAPQKGEVRSKSRFVTFELGRG